MKFNVLGVGIVGITSAYQLAKAGYEVTVIDRQGGPALETSFANANGSLVRLLLAWAAPASRRRSSKGLFVEHAQLLLRRPRIDGAMLSWLVKMLSNCTSGRYGNQAAGLPVKGYSLMIRIIDASKYIVIFDP